MSLNVNQIFQSISGEVGGFPQGTWTTFIRLQGCNLRCSWCDAQEAQKQGEGYSVPITKVLDYCETHHVLITGGEPLLQASGVSQLVERLILAGKEVQIETNGSYSLPNSHFVASIPMSRKPIHWVIDHKCLSSDMSEQMPSPWELAREIAFLHKYGDEAYIKWVVNTETDLHFALPSIRKLMCEVRIENEELLPKLRGKLLISPVDAHEQPEKVMRVVEHIRQQDPELLDYVVFSVQLHKILKLL